MRRVRTHVFTIRAACDTSVGAKPRRLRNHAFYDGPLPNLRVQHLAANGPGALHEYQLTANVVE